MSDVFQEILAGLRDGSVVPYLGPGALAGSADPATGKPIPADGHSLILALNNGQPMAPKLMYEFSRAAMHVELKRGRASLKKFLDQLYGATAWSRAPLHDWLATLKPRYVIDTNRDTQLQDSYRDTPHLLITGTARIGGTDYRFRIHRYDGGAYREIDQQEADTTLPILFKPLGTPRPAGDYIVSDADYVDYITELMGGFAIPAFLKLLRRGKRYLLLGLRLTRDTERMILSDVIRDAADHAGWALIPDPTQKEIRFCAKLGLEVIDGDIGDLFAADGVALPSQALATC